MNIEIFASKKMNYYSGGVVGDDDDSKAGTSINRRQFHQCEESVCQMKNGVKLNPFYVRKMRSGTAEGEPTAANSTADTSSTVNPMDTRCDISHLDALVSFSPAVACMFSSIRDISYSNL